jgi:hypothetical protein
VSEIWKELFKLAHRFLLESGIPSDRWTIGGGTVLMLHYNHRLSKDIDIFFNDAQFLTYLTPRLNETVANYVRDYDEQSNFLKLRFKEGEIDYIVAPNLTSTKPEIFKIEGISVRADTPEEVIVKKIFYRTESLKARDIMDIAVVFKHKGDSLIKYLKICAGKIDILKERVEWIQKDYLKTIETMEIYDNETAISAINIVQELIEKLTPKG